MTACGLLSLWSCGSIVVTASHDIVLVGGGGAGLRAAVAIAETNPRLDVAVVSKVYPMRSHTVSAEGGAAGVARADVVMTGGGAASFAFALDHVVRD